MKLHHILAAGALLAATSVTALAMSTPAMAWENFNNNTAITGTNAGSMGSAGIVVNPGFGAANVSSWGFAQGTATSLAGFGGSSGNSATRTGQGANGLSFGNAAGSANAVDTAGAFTFSKSTFTFPNFGF